MGRARQRSREAEETHRTREACHGGDKRQGDEAGSGSSWRRSEVSVQAEVQEAGDQEKEGEIEGQEGSEGQGVPGERGRERQGRELAAPRAASFGLQGRAHHGQRSVPHQERAALQAPAAPCRLARLVPRPSRRNRGRGRSKLGTEREKEGKPTL